MSGMDREAADRADAGRAPKRHPLASKRSMLMMLAVVVAIALVTSLIYLNSGGAAELGPVASARPKDDNISEAVKRLPAPDLLRPLSPADAQAANSLRPVLTRPDTAAVRFAFSGDQISKMRAIDCLTQAIYYEAASEGVDGGRAVAQVVLNRVRHAAYPNSICSVVYEGSARVTGCQFSFTCDGSLARVPQAYLWARSRRIAGDAIAGTVFALVGHATHYHADYVLPYWADSLDKVAVIGRHIFYRFRGVAGSVRAFNQLYASAEPAPALAPATNVIEESLQAFGNGVDAIAAPMLPALEEDRIEALKTGPKPAVETNLPLEADLARGMLIIGETSPNASRVNSRTAKECKNDEAIRIKPVGANDLQSQSNKIIC